MAVKRNLYNQNIIYIIDMSSLKELHDRYPKNVFPTIWQQIASLIQDEQLYSHIEVLREIKNTIYPTDKLLQWSNKNKKIFSGMDNCQISKMPLIKNKFNPDYWNNNMNRPAPWADPGGRSVHIIIPVVRIEFIFYQRHFAYLAIIHS